MILVDSSVWIDFFRGRNTPAADWLDANLGGTSLLVGDLILAEVLQGFQSDRDFRKARQILGVFQVIGLVDPQVALQAARNHRLLRGKGITPRKTIDTLIATSCILKGLPLLHSDRDFDPFSTHLGLRVIKTGA